MRHLTKEEKQEIDEFYRAQFMTTNPKSKCCVEHWDKMPFMSEHIWKGDIHGIPFGNCTKCGKSIEEWNTKTMQLAYPQDQPTSRLDEVAENWAKALAYSKVSFKDGIKSAIQEYTSDLHQSLTKQNEELAKVKANHNYFVSSMAGSFYGLLTHPSDIPLNGCLISEPSKEKMREVYRQVLKEKQAIDSAITAQEKIK